jgi:hypothetical protein
MVSTICSQWIFYVRTSGVSCCLKVKLELPTCGIAISVRLVVSNTS